MAPKRRNGLQKWGMALALARETRGLAASQLAEMAHVAASTLSQWENGRRCPDREDVKRVDGVLGANGRLLNLFDELTRSEISPEWTIWRNIEEQAIRLLSCDHSVIPGLLQTEDYARQILRHDRHSPIDLEHRVQARMERRNRTLETDNPPTAVFIIGEAALRNRVGTREVMHEQINSLIDFAQRDNIIIYIVPEDAGYHRGHDGAFMIAKLNDRELGFQDAIWTGHVLTENQEISALGDYWQFILSKALTADASLALLRKEAEKWKS